MFDMLKRKRQAENLERDAKKQKTNTITIQYQYSSFVLANSQVQYISVDPDIEVWQLLELLNTNEHQVYFNGSILNEEYRLKDQGVQNNSLVCLCVKDDLEWNPACLIVSKTLQVNLFDKKQQDYIDLVETYGYCYCSHTKWYTEFEDWRGSDVLFDPLLTRFVFPKVFYANKTIHVHDSIIVDFNAKSRLDFENCDIVKQEALHVCIVKLDKDELYSNHVVYQTKWSHFKQSRLYIHAMLEPNQQYMLCMQSNNHGKKEYPRIVFRTIHTSFITKKWIQKAQVFSDVMIKTTC
jgi:hypothetical protein